jgi:hypothetical protein
MTYLCTSRNNLSILFFKMRAPNDLGPVLLLSCLVYGFLISAFDLGADALKVESGKAGGVTARNPPRPRKRRAPGYMAMSAGSSVFSFMLTCRKRSWKFAALSLCSRQVVIPVSRRRLDRQRSSATSKFPSVKARSIPSKSEHSPLKVSAGSFNTVHGPICELDILSTSA